MSASATTTATLYLSRARDHARRCGDIDLSHGGVFPQAVPPASHCRRGDCGRRSGRNLAGLANRNRAAGRRLPLRHDRWPDHRRSFRPFRAVGDPALRPVVRNALVVFADGPSGSRICRLAVVDHGRADACRHRLRSGDVIPRPGIGFDSDLRPALSGAARSGRAGGDGEIFLPEHPFVGVFALRVQLSLWLGGSVRLDELHHFLQQARTSEQSSLAASLVYVKTSHPSQCCSSSPGSAFG